MEDIKTTLSAIRAHRVLDLATGAGNFALRLAAELGAYDEILAVDSQARAVENAAKNLAEIKGASAQIADAAALPFEAASFDLVSISNSLHHFRDPHAVLREAFRVLAPGGFLLILEMHRESEDKAALTHVQLHHWWAAIDGESGVFHAETYDRAGIKALLAPYPLEEGSWIEVQDTEGDPREPELLAEIDGIVDSYLKRIAETSPRREELAARGEELRAWAKEQGFRSAPSLFFVGRKPN